MTNQWIWRYEGYDPGEEGLRETLCALGNGYFGSRAALPESVADGTHYPGTYLAGVFNRLQSEISGRLVENESMVNVPNWLVLTFTADDGTRFDPDSCEVLDHEIELDMRRCVLTRRSRLQHPDGRILSIAQRRIVSLRDPHLAALETSLVAENWSGPLTVRSAIDGSVTNGGVARYHDLPSRHLATVVQCEAPPDRICLEVETTNSKVRIAQTARTRVFRDGERLDTPRAFVRPDDGVAHDIALEMTEGDELIVEKVVALYTSRDLGIYEPHHESEIWAARAPDFDEMLERHIVSWRHAWDRGRIDIDGLDVYTESVLNLHILHLLQTTSKNSAALDAGVPARGLNGEAYRGHIFWDELFIFPFLNWRIPELTRALLVYRGRRLDQARAAARAEGFVGAMYPWQSGSNGREETQTMHLNPRSGRWLPDASHRQRHVNIAIATNIWSYWEATHDLEFMRFWGAEMLLEITRFWSSIATYNHALDRYEIKGVMGPDEYHDGYPDREEPGLDNNAYTNVMAVLCIERAFETLDEVLPATRAKELKEKLDIGPEELDRWGDISRKMRLCFHDDHILSQFEGYGDLDELDWAGLQARHGNIQRLDRILEAEGDSPNRYKLAKQPDVLMLFYVLSAEEIASIFDKLGYEFDDDFIRRNVEYYHDRTSHGSTLSQMIHAWVFSRLDRDRSWKLMRTALVADVEDVQGGTTAEGIHLGAMAGTVDILQRCYTGIETRGDRLILNPSLPEEIDSIRFQIHYRGHHLELNIERDQTSVRAIEDGGRAINLEINGQVLELHEGGHVEVAS